MEWSIAGRWNDVLSAEPWNVLYATKPTQCYEILKAGNYRSVPFAVPAGESFRLIALNRTESAILSSSERRGLTAFEPGGKLLWSYGSDFRESWIVDLDGDGADEVIAYINSASERRYEILNSKGEVILKKEVEFAFRDLCTIRSASKEAGRVVAISAANQLCLFDKDLELVKYFPIKRISACIARTVTTATNSPDDIVVAGNNGQLHCFVFAASAEGKIKWFQHFPVRKGGAVSSVSAFTSSAWIAVAIEGGAVHVIDAKDGQTIARWYGLGDHPKVAWSKNNDVGEPLLVVATGAQLNAYRVIKFD